MAKENSKVNKEVEINSNHLLFFDLDGTLVHTDYSNYLAYKKALEIVSPHLDGIKHNPNKRITRTLLKEIFPKLTNAELTKIIWEKENCYDEFLSSTEINRTVFNILLKYSSTNKCVLVTNCRKNRAISILKHHDLTSKFNLFFFREDTQNQTNKFENAIDKMKILPQNIIAFENEEIEIKNAIISGIKIINPIIINK